MLPKRLTAHRFVIHQARNRAEKAAIAGARKAYAAGWAVLKDALAKVPEHPLAKAAGDPSDEHVLNEVKAAMQKQLEAMTANMAGHFIAGENAWFRTQGVTWDALKLQELTESYQRAFAPIGGFKGIADTAVAPIQGILRDYYADPAVSMSDLTDQLQTYFSPYKAEQVGITETTRMAAVNADLVAARVGAENWEWDSSNDGLVCDECAALDGQTFALADNEDPPPAHPGCRCDKAILIEDDEEPDMPDVGDD